MRAIAGVFSVSVSLTVLALAAPAAADVTKASCVDADTQAQTLRRAGKLSDARKQLLICGDPSCPEMVREDCTTRMDEVEAAQPSIIFDAKDGAGADLSAVTVTLDGQPLTDKLDGSALRVDPGPHTFTFSVSGQPLVTRSFVVKESEKGRHERIVVGAPIALPPAEPPAPPAQSGLSKTKVIGIVLGGAGIAGIAVGSAFGLMDASEAKKQKQDCPSSDNCPRYSQASSDHSTGSTDGLISTVSFIAGGALLAGGAVLFLALGRSSAEKSGPPAPSTGLVVAPSIGPGGGGVLLRGEF